ncbi:MAG: 3-phosphoshikimate 1-carboxyvinyltransferase [Pelagibacterales bacterium MED-G41]|mgnify:FL=1|nr:MAG: 3-phosphoshikimate 1-carboxyvinyltransferase [Pelagibacterales bacterium MED-G41]
MKKSLKINKLINSFNKTISVEGDKSLSIRWVLLSSLSKKKSVAYNLLKSEDVFSALHCVKKLGAKVKMSKDKCIIIGVGLNYKQKENLILNAGNSGTLGRLILGLLINYDNKIKLTGDKSLSKRDFSRVIKPLKKFGASFSLKKTLPLTMKGINKPKSIDYIENKGSAQCKTSIMLAALKSEGVTKIKAKKSRDHTEILFKYLKIPLRIKKYKKYDIIQIKGVKNIKPLNYKIPGDISSCSFFIVLTILSEDSKLLIKNVNINPSRIGIIDILKKMGASIKILNKKNYKGEKTADIFVKSSKNLKAINCPTKYNSRAIDEFLIIFLVAAKSKGISIFKNLAELNQKESPRLIWGSKILNYMGIRTKLTKNSIKIYGNPNLIIKNNIQIKNFLKDHRVFMMSVIAALTFKTEGNWDIYDLESIKTSFPTFLKTLKKLM